MVVDERAFVPVAIWRRARPAGSCGSTSGGEQLMVGVGSQASPQLIYFGTDARLKDPSKWVVPIEVARWLFLRADRLMFIGPGQEMGRRFARIDNRMLAYTADILGSLTGIAVFGVISYLHVAASIWFAIALAIGVWFVAAPAVAACAAGGRSSGTGRPG